jgi:DNA-binding transcriptional LysR family regulator
MDLAVEDLSPLDSRQLQTLVLVAEEGSFVGAADALGISQAAVSQQMAALERSAGATLFDRPGGPRPVTLTPAGRIVHEHAIRILTEIDSTRRALEDLSTGIRGRLVCGTFQSVSVQLLPDLVAQVRRETPDLGIELVERDANEELIELLRDGVLDVAFLSEDASHPDLDIIELGRDPFLVLIPAVHDFPLPADAAAFPAEYLMDTPMVGQQPHALQQEIDDRLRVVGIYPRYVFRTNDNGAVQAMVRAGMGPAVMPRLAIDTDDPGVVILPLDPPIEPRRILIAQRASAHSAPAVDRFIELARGISRTRLMTTRGSSRRQQ